MISKRQFAAIAVTGLLGLAPAVASAAPPVLSNLVVEPTILMLGSGSQTINISVSASDPDGDLDPEKTKVTVKFVDKTKEKMILLDQGGGQFAGQIEINTATAQTFSVKIKAKDLAKEKAEKLTIANPRTIVQVDPQTGRQTIISNRQAGMGLPFLSLTDIVSLPNGSRIVTDRLLREVLGVDPETGRRRVLSR